MADDEHPRRSARYARSSARQRSARTDLDEARVRSYLVDLADRVRRGLALVGEGEDRYFADDDYAFRSQRFGRMLVIEIAEIANDRLPRSLREAHPDIPWRLLQDVRNYPAHDYRGTGDRIVWEVLQDHLPRMIEGLRDEYERRGIDVGTA